MVQTGRTSQREILTRAVRQARLLEDLSRTTSSDPQFLNWQSTTRFLLAEVQDSAHWLQEFDQLSFRSFPQRVATGADFPDARTLARGRFANDCAAARNLLEELVLALRMPKLRSLQNS
jgi:hypothetical protein